MTASMQYLHEKGHFVTNDASQKVHAINTVFFFVDKFKGRFQNFRMVTKNIDMCFAVAMGTRCTIRIGQS